jgi:hypothetical protein
MIQDPPGQSEALNRPPRHAVEASRQQVGDVPERQRCALGQPNGRWRLGPTRSRASLRRSSTAGRRADRVNGRRRAPTRWRSKSLTLVKSARQALQRFRGLNGSPSIRGVRYAGQMGPAPAGLARRTDPEAGPVRGRMGPVRAFPFTHLKSWLSVGLGPPSRDSDRAQAAAGVPHPHPGGVGSN